MDFDFDDDFDDYEDDFDFEPENEFDDGFELESDISSDQDFENENDLPEDRVPAEEWMFVGGAMGWAYEEGLNERRQNKKRKKSPKNDGVKIIPRQDES